MIAVTVAAIAKLKAIKPIILRILSSGFPCGT